MRFLPTVLLLCGLWSAAALAQGAPAPTPAEEVRFDILEFVVEGDTVLGADAIERAVYPFLGPQRTAADAEGARRALEKAYHEAGFLSVNVALPPQQVLSGGGEVRLQVLQAAVQRLRITGAEYTLPSAVREAVPALRPGTVPNFNEMQQQLGALARSSADREVTPLIAAGTQPGTMDVELKVQDSLPVHGSLELNNKQSRNTSAGRLEAALSYDNLFQRGHSLAASWFYSPRRPDEADILTLNYQRPLGGEGDRLTASVQASDSNTPTLLGGATVSRGQTWRLRWRDQLGGFEGLDHALSYGLAWRHLRDANRDVGGFDTPTPPLRYASFSAGYELEITGATAGRVSRLQIEASFSPPGLNAREIDCFGTRKDQFTCKRASAGPAFQVYTLNLSHREPLGRWALAARLQGQFSDAPLVPSEQMSFGGAESVRGYHDGELSADIGATLRLELLAPAWRPTERLSLQPALFVDQAAGRRLYALAGEDKTIQLASAGLGLRVETRFGLQAALHWAQVLKGSGRSQRVDLSLRQAF